MKIRLITHFIFVFAIVQTVKCQTFDKSFSGCWADTFWDFEFKKNGQFTRISNGHYGNTTVKGKYQILNDTLKILTGHQDTHGTINELYLIQEDTILVDIELGYGYLKSSNKYPRNMNCDLSYPDIIGTNQIQIKELEMILNLALNSNPITQYYHFEELPVRKPIIATYKKLVANIELKGKKAFFIDKENIKDRFFLELKDIEIYSNHISFKVSVADEGVEAKFYYYKEEDVWKSNKPIIIEK
jgi:hypothetical protein